MRDQSTVTGASGPCGVAVDAARHLNAANGNSHYGTTWIGRRRFSMARSQRFITSVYWPSRGSLSPTLQDPRAPTPTTTLVWVGPIDGRADDQLHAARCHRPRTAEAASSRSTASPSSPLRASDAQARFRTLHSQREQRLVARGRALHAAPSRGAGPRRRRRQRVGAHEPSPAILPPHTAPLRIISPSARPRREASPA